MRTRRSRNQERQQQSPLVGREEGHVASKRAHGLALDDANDQSAPGPSSGAPSSPRNVCASDSSPASVLRGNKPCPPGAANTRIRKRTAKAIAYDEQNSKRLKTTEASCKASSKKDEAAGTSHEKKKKNLNVGQRKDKPGARARAAAPVDQDATHWNRLLQLAQRCRKNRFSQSTGRALQMCDNHDTDRTFRDGQSTDKELVLQHHVEENRASDGENTSATGLEDDTKAAAAAAANAPAAHAAGAATGGSGSKVARNSAHESGAASSKPNTDTATRGPARTRKRTEKGESYDEQNSKRQRKAASAAADEAAPEDSFLDMLRQAQACKKMRTFKKDVTDAEMTAADALVQLAGATSMMVSEEDITEDEMLAANALVQLAGGTLRIDNIKLCQVDGS